MKPLIVLALFMVDAFGRVGETMEQVSARLGPSSTEYAQPSGPTKHWESRKTATGGLAPSITIHFRAGRSFQESVHTIEKPEISRYLVALGRGRGPWQTILVPETGEEFYYNGSEVAWYNQAKTLIVVALPPAKQDGTPRTAAEGTAAIKRTWIKPVEESR